MSTALGAIRRALNDRMAAFAAGGIPIAWEGVPYEPLAGEPWLQAQITARTRAPMTLDGPAPHLWRGTFQIVVKTPAAEGLAPGLDLAAAVGSHFPRALLMIDGAARVVVESVNFPPGYVTAGWASHPVLVSWYCEELPQ